MLDLEEAISEAHCHLNCLHEWIGDGGTIAHVRDDTVTIELSGDSVEINLGLIQHLLDILRKMDR